MSYYDFDTDEIGKQLIPSKLRQLKQIAWIKVLLAPVKYIHTLFFTHYCTAEPFLWSSPAYYGIGDICRWKDKKAYISLTSTGTGLDYAPTGALYSSEKWMVYSDLFIGIDTRVHFNGQFINLINAINKFLGVTPLTSTYMDTSLNIIYVSVGYYINLGANNTEREAALRRFIDRYRPAGFVYTIVTY